MIARTNLTCPDCGHPLDVRVIATGDDEVRVETIPAHNLNQNESMKGQGQ